MVRKGIKTTEERPHQYYYCLKTDETEVEEAESETIDGRNSIKKIDLYPLLADYLWSEFGLYSKRIDEKKHARNRNDPDNNK